MEIGDALGASPICVFTFYIPKVGFGLFQVGNRSCVVVPVVAGWATDEYLGEQLVQGRNLGRGEYGFNLKVLLDRELQEPFLTGGNPLFQFFQSEAVAASLNHLAHQLFLAYVERIGNEDCFVLVAGFDLLVLFFLFVVKGYFFAHIAAALAVLMLLFRRMACATQQNPKVDCRKDNQNDAKDEIGLLHTYFNFSSNNFSG